MAHVNGVMAQFKTLQKEMKEMKELYEDRIKSLEEQVEELKADKIKALEDDEEILLGPVCKEMNSEGLCTLLKDLFKEEN